MAAVLKTARAVSPLSWVRIPRPPPRPAKTARDLRVCRSGPSSFEARAVSLRLAGSPSGRLAAANTRQSLHGRSSNVPVLLVDPEGRFDPSPGGFVLAVDALRVDLQ